MHSSLRSSKTVHLAITRPTPFPFEVRQSLLDWEVHTELLTDGEAKGVRVRRSIVDELDETIRPDLIARFDEDLPLTKLEYAQIVFYGPTCRIAPSESVEHFTSRLLQCNNQDTFDTDLSRQLIAINCLQGYRFLQIIARDFARPPPDLGLLGPSGSLDQLLYHMLCASEVERRKSDLLDLVSHRSAAEASIEKSRLKEIRAKFLAHNPNHNLGLGVVDRSQKLVFKLPSKCPNKRVFLSLALQNLSPIHRQTNGFKPPGSAST